MMIYHYLDAVYILQSDVMAFTNDESETLMIHGRTPTHFCIYGSWLFAEVALFV